MTFGERVVGAMKLDPNAFEDVERDPTAMGQAVGVIALQAVSTALGNIYWGGLSGVVWGVLIALVSYVIWTVLVWAIGTKVMPDPETKAELPETFRTLAFAASPGLLGIITIIPIIGYLIQLVLWIWSIAAMVIAVRSVLDYTNTGKAVVVVIIGFIISLIVNAILAFAFIGTSMMRGAYNY